MPLDWQILGQTDILAFKGLGRLQGLILEVCLVFVAVWGARRCKPGSFQSVWQMNKVRKLVHSCMELNF